ncbi:MAG: O-antigen ligase family protein [Dokdonella sp.]
MREPLNPIALEAVWPALLVLAVLVLLPLGRTAELPLACGGIAALVLFARGWIASRDDAMNLVMMLFACYWVPAALSGFAAVEPAKTWSTVATTLRFLPFALFAMWALRDASRWASVTSAIAVVVALWALDAYVQMATGFSLGGAAEMERISGIFGAGNLKLGPVLAVLSPFVLLAARARFGRRGLALSFVFLAAPILLAGSRAAWVSYALVGIVVAWLETRDSRRFIAVLAAFTLGIGAIAAFAWHDSTRFGARIERSLLALDGTEAAVDYASAGRLSIWRTAIAMSEAHPLTGVGARGFRYAYPRYAAAHDHFIDTASDTGASHAHQIVLEILSETGVVGLAFWLAGTWLALRAWTRAAVQARARALAPALALIAMCFPINTHLAFYSAWWGLLFWWLLALYCAALGARQESR